MYCKIKSNHFTFKLTDLLGIIVLIYPSYLLIFYFPPNYVFYLTLGIALLFLYQNFFGLRGFYVKLTNSNVVFYDKFFPRYIKIKNIEHIEKEGNMIFMKTFDGKFYVVYVERILKTERYKTNDFFYDIHNKIYSKTLKV